ncbi:TonB-dependent receptor [Novosphingobium sp. PP1Y]|uniref:TonB-dependent receptor n=1 Tax=Novosphingobium sp. PP1Y TaxID=702113 RepID=UPI00020EF96C|nr:TonB-dependent receptor [Novosphingobium sp. PP1Y]CCA90550.1 TonB-dependent receptor [Novosphingobium sp. PP1Y]
MTGKTALALALSTSLASIVQPAFASEDRAATETGTSLDIVVTATRREQKLQDVPIAVTAISAEQFVASNYKDPSELQYLSPSVQVSSSGGAGFNVRGVGTNSFNAATEQTVGLVVDGIVYGFVNDLGADMSDVSRVEILRGPQGTQFGKNASAGVINITTERPSTDRTYSVLHASYGSYDDTNASYRVNVPVTDTLAVMGVASYQNRDGWAWNPVRQENAGDRDQVGLKGKLKWAPTVDFDIFASVDYRRSYSSPAFLSSYRRLGIGSGTVPPGFGILDYGIEPGPNNTETGLASDSYQINRVGGGTFEANYHFGNYTLTALTGYRMLGRDAFATLGSTPITAAEGPVRVRSDQFSQELRLSSSGGQFIDFTSGLYYYHRSSKEVSMFAGDFGGLAELLHGPGALLSFSGGRDYLSYSVDSIAGFIDGTVNVSDDLKLILGGRLTRDKASSSLYTVEVEGVYPLTGMVSGPGSAKTANTDFSWRAGLQYNFTPNVMAYFTAARGYKGPLAIAVAGSSARIVDPETVKSLEAGIKTTWLNGNLLFNLTAFREKFRNFQTSVPDTTLLPPGFALGNAGGMKTQGIEVEFSVKPTPGLTLIANGTYQDAKYTDFLSACYSEYEPIQPPVTDDPNVVGACYTVPGTGLSYIQAKGSPAPNASKWNLALAASFEQPIGEDLAVDATANYTYRSDFYTNGVDPNTRVDGRGIVNVNLGVGAQDDTWRVGVFARNLFDKYYVSGIELGGFDEGSLVNVLDLEARRTLGVVLDTRF